MKKNVRFEKQGILFVDIGNMTVEVKNPFDYIPTFVEVAMVGSNYYVKGYEPKEDNKKLKTDKKIESKDKD